MHVRAEVERGQIGAGERLAVLLVVALGLAGQPYLYAEVDRRVDEQVASEAEVKAEVVVIAVVVRSTATHAVLKPGRAEQTSIRRERIDTEQQVHRTRAQREVLIVNSRGPGVATVARSHGHLAGDERFLVSAAGFLSQAIGVARG